METHPLCQPSAATSTATAAARLDTIRRVLGDGDGQRHDVVENDGGGGQWHHVVAQFDDASGGQRHHLSSWKQRRRRDDHAMLVHADLRIYVEVATGPDRI